MAYSLGSLRYDFHCYFWNCVDNQVRERLLYTIETSKSGEEAERIGHPLSVEPGTALTVIRSSVFLATLVFANPFSRSDCA